MQDNADNKINMLAQKGEGTDPNKTGSTQEYTKYWKGIYHFLSTVNMKSTPVIKKEFEDTAKKNILLDNAVKFLGNIYDKEYSIKKGTSPLDDSEFLDDLLSWIKYTPEYKKYKIEDDNEKKEVVISSEVKPTGLDQTKGNAFRKWMKDQHPDFRDSKGEELSYEEGKNYLPDNPTIREAYAKYGKEYQK